MIIKVMLVHAYDQQLLHRGIIIIIVSIEFPENRNANKTKPNKTKKKNKTTAVNFGDKNECKK